MHLVLIDVVHLVLAHSDRKMQVALCSVYWVFLVPLGIAPASCLSTMRTTALYQVMTLETISMRIRAICKSSKQEQLKMLLINLSAFLFVKRTRSTVGIGVEAKVKVEDDVSVQMEGAMRRKLCGELMVRMMQPWVGLRGYGCHEKPCGNFQKGRYLPSVWTIRVQKNCQQGIRA